MNGYAIKVSFANGEKGIFERVTMRKAEKILVIKKLGDEGKRIYTSKRDVLNRIRNLRSLFSDIASFEIIYSFGREVQKLH